MSEQEATAAQERQAAEKGSEATAAAIAPVTGNYTVVLGLGNLLRRDEGLGIRALELLQARYILPESVLLVDGGTLGLDLLAYLEEASQLLILDATVTDEPPGSLLRAVNQEIPAFFGMRTSPHEIALADLLAVLRLRGTMPARLVLWGMQPATIELGWELSEPVAARLGDLVDAVAQELQSWGLHIEKRHQANVNIR